MDDVLIFPRGPNKGIWCRTPAAFNTIAAAAKKLPPGEATPLNRMPALGTYTGTVVAIASTEKWRELQAEYARVSDERAKREDAKRLSPKGASAAPLSGETP